MSNASINGNNLPKGKSTKARVGDYIKIVSTDKDEYFRAKGVRFGDVFKVESINENRIYPVRFSHNGYDVFTKDDEYEIADDYILKELWGS